MMGAAYPGLAPEVAMGITLRRGNKNPEAFLRTRSTSDGDSRVPVQALIKSVRSQAQRISEVE